MHEGKKETFPTLRERLPHQGPPRDNRKKRLAGLPRGVRPKAPLSPTFNASSASPTLDHSVSSVSSASTECVINTAISVSSECLEVPAESPAPTAASADTTHVPLTATLPAPPAPTSTPLDTPTLPRGAQPTLLAAMTPALTSSWSTHAPPDSPDPATHTESLFDQSDGLAATKGPAHSPRKLRHCNFGATPNIYNATRQSRLPTANSDRVLRSIITPWDKLSPQDDHHRLCDFLALGFHLPRPPSSHRRQARHRKLSGRGH